MGHSELRESGNLLEKNQCLHDAEGGKDMQAGRKSTQVTEPGLAVGVRGAALQGLATALRSVGCSK